MFSHSVWIRPGTEVGPSGAPGGAMRTQPRWTIFVVRSAGAAVRRCRSMAGPSRMWGWPTVNVTQDIRLFYHCRTLPYGPYTAGIEVPPLPTMPLHLEFYCADKNRPTKNIYSTRSRSGSLQWKGCGVSIDRLLACQFSLRRDTVLTIQPCCCLRRKCLGCLQWQGR